MIQKLNGKDRVPTNVLLNGAIRYGVYDSNGTLLRYEYMKREDEPVEVGTDVNKVLWDTIDDNFTELSGNLENIKKYNIPTTTFITDTTDIIPKIWTQVTSDRKYTSTSGIILTAERGSGLTNACDGDLTNYWTSLHSPAGSTDYIKFEFPQPVCITKIKIKTDQATVFGSNDDDNWVQLLETEYEDYPSLEEYTLNNPASYKYYKIQASYIYEFEVSETKNTLLTLNNYIASYEQNMIVNIKTATVVGDVQININNKGNKDITSSLESNTEYELVYNGTSFDAFSVRNEIEEIKQAIIDLGGVI